MALVSAEFTIQITNSVSVSSTAKISLSISGTADRLVLLSGNNQVGTVGTALSNGMKVQIVDLGGTPYPGGITLSLMQMLGFDSLPLVSLATTVSNGTASFNGTFEFSPTAWQVVPIGTSFPGTSRILFNHLTTAYSNGTASFTSKPTLAGTSVRGVGIGDWNGDGKLDVATTNYGSTTINIFTGNGDGTFTAQAALSGLTAPYGMVVGDWRR